MCNVRPNQPIMCNVRLLAISRLGRSGFDQNPYITQLKTPGTPYITQLSAYFTQQTPYITQHSAYFTHTPFPASPSHTRVSATLKTLKLLNLIKLNKTRSPRARALRLPDARDFFFFYRADQTQRAKAD